MGTSGSEMRKPARAKRLAIQRIAALFSLGTNRRRMAPTSGVKRMMERMWFCIENSSQLPASSIPVSVQKSGREPGVLIGSLRLSVRIIKNKTQQARDHNEGVPLHLSPFEQAEWVGQDACQDRGAVDPEAVDDPGVEPLGNRGGNAASPAASVDGAVHDVHVGPTSAVPQAEHAEADVPCLTAPGEEVVVELVDVPLVVQRGVERLGGDFDGLGVALIGLAVGFPRHASADQSGGDREEHQAILGAAGVFFFFFLSGSELGSL